MTFCLKYHSPLLLLLGLLLLASTGCSDSKYDLAPVSGQVTYEGKPIDWGMLVFTPQKSSDNPEAPGKSAVGPLDSEGKFELSTYGKHDGAIVGFHSIRYSYGLKNERHREAAEKFFSALGQKIPRKMKAKVASVEVTAGENVVNIELVR